MKAALPVLLLVCLQGCAPESAALKERRDDSSAMQYHEYRHDIEQRLGQSVGIVPRSDGGFMELYLAPAGLQSGCRWRRVFVRYNDAGRVLSVLVERPQSHADPACTAGSLSGLSSIPDSQG